MIDLSVKLINIAITKDAIGNEIETKTYTEVSIIKHEEVFSNEFYEASVVGLKPTLRVKISSLNYSGQKKLEYMNQLYEIIRTDTTDIDEISLICERKLGNES